MHARISMKELYEREDRSMIAHARDECAWRILFFSDIIYSGHYLESLALLLWQVLKETVTVLGNSNRTCRVPSLDCSIGRAICVRARVSSVAYVVCELQRIKNNNNNNNMMMMMMTQRILKNNRAVLNRLILLQTKVSLMLQSILCITTNKHLVCVLAVLLHLELLVLYLFYWPPYLSQVIPI